MRRNLKEITEKISIISKKYRENKKVISDFYKF